MSDQKGQEETHTRKRRSAAVREHLLRKAKECDEARRIYIDRLGDAKGNDVFRYMLVLNCIECQGYVAEIQLQAHQSFEWSTRMAVAGFAIVAVAVLVMSVLPSLHLSAVPQVENGVKTIGSISTLTTAFISAIFFYLYREALHRMDQFHAQLRETQRIVVALFLRGLAAGTDGEEVKREILRFLMHDSHGSFGAPDPARLEANS